MNCSIKIEIYTSNLQVGFDLIGTPNVLTANTPVEIPGTGNATITLLPIRGQRDLSTGIGALEFVLSLGSGVAGGVVANWLYEKIKGKASKLIIDRMEIRIEKHEIERIIIERIEKHK